MSKGKDGFPCREREDRPVPFSESEAVWRLGRRMSLLPSHILKEEFVFSRQQCLPRLDPPRRPLPHLHYPLPIVSCSSSHRLPPSRPRLPPARPRPTPSRPPPLSSPEPFPPCRPSRIPVPVDGRSRRRKRREETSLPNQSPNPLRSLGRETSLEEDLSLLLRRSLSREADALRECIRLRRRRKGGGTEP